MHSTITQTSARQAFYEKIDGENMTALWNVLGNLITPEPRSACRPAAWRFADIRRYMLETGILITATEAERRVLILENPGLRGQSRITTSLYAGVQLVMPDEVAPSHRHSQSALRFVLEGQGAYTAVDGERAVMSPGDFIITPSMTWHDHGNATTDPMFWLDGLDIPLVQFLDASFAEGMGSAPQPLRRAVGESFARFGHNLAPVDFTPGSQTSPIFAYPYEHTRTALEALKTGTEWDPCHGLKLKYMNPLTGSYAMPTIGAFIQLLPTGLPLRAIVRPTRRCSCRLKVAVGRGSAMRSSSGRQKTSSLRRAGSGSVTRPTKRPSFSAIPIGRFRKSSICLERIAAMPETGTSETGKIRLHNFFRSSTSHRVRIALNVKGVAYDYVAYRLRTGDHRGAVFAALNPQMLVPALVMADGTVLTQSLAIIEYLDETVPNPPLLPPDALGRARVRSLAQMLALDVHPLNNLRVLNQLRTTFGADDAAVAAWFTHWVSEAFAALEKRLADDPHTGRFCHGNTPGLADICLAAQIASNARFHIAHDEYPTIGRIAAACEELPAFAAALPIVQPDRE